MQPSVIRKWWPVTYEYGLIKTDVISVMKTRPIMYQEHNMDVDVVELIGGLEDFFYALEPLSPAPTKEMYLTTNFGWTVFFRNSTRGSDAFEPMIQLSKRLGVTAMRVCVSPTKAVYPSVIWEIYDRPEAGGDKWGRRRSIAVANDGGRWVFHQSGEPFLFEEFHAYDARLKKNRFTEEMLHRYLKNFGIPPLTDDVFSGCERSENIIVSRPVHKHLPAMTLAEFLIAKS